MYNSSQELVHYRSNSEMYFKSETLKYIVHMLTKVITITCRNDMLNGLRDICCSLTTEHICAIKLLVE